MRRFFSVLVLLYFGYCSAQVSSIGYGPQALYNAQYNAVRDILFERSEMSKVEKLDTIRKILFGNKPYLKWNDAQRENSAVEQRIDYINQLVLKNETRKIKSNPLMIPWIRHVVHKTNYPLQNNNKLKGGENYVPNDTVSPKKGRKKGMCYPAYVCKKDKDSVFLNQEDAIRAIIDSKNPTIGSEEKVYAVRKAVMADSNFLVWSDSLKQKQLIDKRLSMITKILDTTPSLSGNVAKFKLSSIQSLLKYRNITDLYNEDYKIMRSQQKLVIYNKNALKFDLMRTFSYGEFVFSYERLINKRFSCEIGAGPSLSYYELFIGHDEGDQSDIFEGEVIRSLLTGFVIHSDFRWYFQKSRNGLAGFYTSPELLYRFDTYGHHAPNRSTGTLCLNLGYQVLGRKHIGIDFTIGPGLSYTSGYVKVYASNGFTEFSAGIPKAYKYGKGFSAYINLGIKLVVGW